MCVLEGGRLIVKERLHTAVDNGALVEFLQGFGDVIEELFCSEGGAEALALVEGEEVAAMCEFEEDIPCTLHVSSITWPV